MRRAFLAAWLSVSAVAFADGLVVRVTGPTCKQGLYPQPDGPFSVYLFCDDAMGSNIGVINVSGAGANLPPARRAKTDASVQWSVTERFWQQQPWAGDITSFAWSPDMRSLYVGTSEIYGTGALYKLDLPAKTYQKLYPNSAVKLKEKYHYSTEITAVDSSTGLVTLEVSHFNDSGNRTVVKTVVVR
jgi:hypothetical protein